MVCKGYIQEKGNVSKGSLKKDQAYLDFRDHEMFFESIVFNLTLNLLGLITEL